MKRWLKNIRGRFQSMAGRRLGSRIDQFSFPLQTDEEKGWRPYPIYSGRMKGLVNISCHVSVLNQGRSPHPPHAHDDEELLLLISGEVDLIFSHPGSQDGKPRQNLKAGQFVYYPIGFSHTLQTVSGPPATYLMFRWNAPTNRLGDQLEYGLFNMYEHMEGGNVRKGFCTQMIFQGPTAYLEKLHCHTSTLTPGTGYDPHTDFYDVAIIVLEGEVETLGKRVGPYGLIFYAAGEPHGMWNFQDKIAKYIVFEFHCKKSLLYKGIRRIVRRIRSSTHQKGNII